MSRDQDEDRTDQRQRKFGEQQVRSEDHHYVVRLKHRRREPKPGERCLFARASTRPRCKREQGGVETARRGFGQASARPLRSGDRSFRLTPIS
jgi:hypothetical protein